MGSTYDLPFSKKICEAPTQFSISSDLRIASAHRTPEVLLKMMKEYASGNEEIIAITVAGLSDVLSSVIPAQRLFPITTCPPDLDKYDFQKVFSTAFAPSDVPVAFVNDPVKAANLVAQIFALSNLKLKELILSKLGEKRKHIEAPDKEAVEASIIHDLRQRCRN